MGWWANIELLEILIVFFKWSGSVQSKSNNIGNGLAMSKLNMGDQGGQVVYGVKKPS